MYLVFIVYNDTDMIYMTHYCFAVDCKWKEWTKWSECSADCGSGEQSRIRGMLVEKYGGQPCEGSAINIRFCNTHFCPSKRILLTVYVVMFMLNFIIFTQCLALPHF